MNDVDYLKVFELLPNITGLPLIRRGSQWFGACRLDGTPHGRWDKTVCSIYKDKVWLLEQGGDSLAIIDWLIEYGGVGSVGEAFIVLHEYSSVNIKVRPAPPKPPLKYIWPSILYREKLKIGEEEDGLFQFLCDYFDRESVVDVYRRYNVSPCDGWTVFWNVDSKGRVCKDKRVLYGSNGRRSKTESATSYYRRADGFRARCLFGIQGATRVVESEKTAVCCALYFGGDWLATGGKNMTTLIDKHHILYPDVDAYKDWSKMFPGQCKKWWEEFGYKPGKKDDIADYIFFKLDKNRELDNINFKLNQTELK